MHDILARELLKRRRQSPRFAQSIDCCAGYCQLSSAGQGSFRIDRTSFGGAANITFCTDNACADCPTWNAFEPNQCKPNPPESGSASISAVCGLPCSLPPAPATPSPSPAAPSAAPSVAPPTPEPSPEPTLAPTPTPVPPTVECNRCQATFFVSIHAWLKWLAPCCTRDGTTLAIDHRCFVTPASSFCRPWRNALGTSLQC